MHLLYHHWLNNSPKIDMENVKAKSGSIVFCNLQLLNFGMPKRKCWRQGELSLPSTFFNAGAFADRGNAVCLLSSVLRNTVHVACPGDASVHL